MTAGGTEPFYHDNVGIPAGLRPSFAELVEWVRVEEEQCEQVLPSLREIVKQVAWDWSRPHVTEDRVPVHLDWYTVGVTSTDDMLAWLDAYVTSAGLKNSTFTIKDTYVMLPFVRKLKEDYGFATGAEAIQWARDGGKYISADE